MAQERYYYNSKNSPLQAVDETIVSKIISMYEEGNSITVIKESFPDVKITNNIHLFLPYEITNEACSCGQLLYKKIEGRTILSSEAIYCPNCRHDGTDDCLCKYCIEKRKNAREIRKEKFLIEWDDYYNEHYNTTIDLNDLSIYEEVQLVILIHIYYNKDSKLFNFQFINETIEYFGQHLLPTEIQEFVQTFIHKKILIPEKNIEFTDDISQNDELGNFEPKLTLRNTKWTLNITRDKKQLTVEYIFNYLIKKEYTSEQREIFWKECYLESLTKYFTHRTKDFINLKVLPQNLELISNDLFKNFSLSKAYNLIYYSINSLVTYQAKYSTTVKSSNTYLRNKILEKIENYKLPENFCNLKDFKPVPLPESYFSKYVKKYILRSSEEYFYHSLTTLKHKF